MKKILFITILSLLLILPAFSQEIIIDTTGKMLLRTETGLYKELHPEPIYIHDGVRISMPLSEFKRLGNICTETDNFEYVTPGRFNGIQVFLVYKFNVIDVSRDGPGFQLTKIMYTFDMETTRESFYKIFQEVLPTLDGIVFDGTAFAKYEAPVENTNDLEALFEKKVNSIQLKAECGTFQTILELNADGIFLEYNSYDFLLDNYK